MADKTEKQRLLQQISYLTGLISRAEQNVSSKQVESEHKPLKDVTCQSKGRHSLQTYSLSTRKNKHSGLDTACRSYYQPLTSYRSSSQSVSETVQANSKHSQINCFQSDVRKVIIKESASDNALVRVNSSTVVDFKSAPQCRKQLFDGMGSNKSQWKFEPAYSSTAPNLALRQTSEKEPTHVRTTDSSVLVLQNIRRKAVTSDSNNRPTQLTQSQTVPPAVAVSLCSAAVLPQGNKQDLISKKQQVAAAQAAMKTKIDTLKGQLESFKKNKRSKAAGHQHSAKEKYPLKSLRSSNNCLILHNAFSIDTSTNASGSDTSCVGVNSGAAEVDCNNHLNNVNSAVSACKVSKSTLKSSPKTDIFPPKPESDNLNVILSRIQGAGIKQFEQSGIATTSVAPPFSALISVEGAGTSGVMVDLLKQKPAESTVKPVVSAAKEHLKKELQVTEEKLSTMRKKMGMMLKESPTKPVKQAAKEALDSSTNQLKPSVSCVLAAIHGCSTSVISPVKPVTSGPYSLASPKVSRSLPFPNRHSLKWTPKHSLSRMPSEKLSVINSPSLRLTLAAKKSFSAAFASVGHHSHFSKTNVLMSSLNGRENLSLRDVSASARRSIESVQTGRLLPHKRRSSTTKTVIGKYKLLRHNRGISPKLPGSNSKNGTARVIVKTRYKLTKVTLSSHAHLQQSAAKQRAAKVIKSKYKLQNIPAQSTPSRLLLSSSGHQRTSGKVKISNTWTFKGNNQRQLQNYSYALSKYRVSAAQSARLNTQHVDCYTRGSSSHFCSPWSKRKLVYQKQNTRYSSSAWLQQAKYTYQKNRSPWSSFDTQATNVQITRRRKACSILKAIQNKQKRLLLKRLLWMKKYSLTRGASNSHSLESSPSKAGSRGRDREHLVMINGILYRSSCNHLTKASSTASQTGHRCKNKDDADGSIKTEGKLSSSVVVKNVKRCNMKTVSVRGVQFKVDARGTKLQRVHSNLCQDKRAVISRVDIGGTTFLQTKDGVLEKVSDTQTRSVVNRVKQRSLAFATAKFRKKNIQGTRKHCLFFSRFGKCSRGADCPFQHDPEKVAICTRFLRGTCKVADCPFSHKVSKEKMPVCIFFLRGVCTRENCPYLHVKVNQGAEVCQDFLTGFCALADKCPKVHTLVCPRFSANGQCPDGKKCHMVHKKAVAGVKKQRSKPRTSSATPSQDRFTTRSEKKRLSADADYFIKEKHRRLNPGLCRQEEQNPDRTSPGPECNATSSDSNEISLDSSLQDSDCSGPKRYRPSTQKPVRLPAFISLAHYSQDDLSAVKDIDEQQQKCLLTKTESSLQIKPRI